MEASATSIAATDTGPMPIYEMLVGLLWGLCPLRTRATTQEGITRNGRRRNNDNENNHKENTATITNVNMNRGGEENKKNKQYDVNDGGDDD